MCEVWLQPPSHVNLNRSKVFQASSHLKLLHRLLVFPPWTTLYLQLGIIIAGRPGNTAWEPPTGDIIYIICSVALKTYEIHIFDDKTRWNHVKSIFLMGKATKVQFLVPWPRWRSKIDGFLRGSSSTSLVSWHQTRRPRRPRLHPPWSTRLDLVVEAVLDVLLLMFKCYSWTANVLDVLDVLDVLLLTLAPYETWVTWVFKVPLIRYCLCMSMCHSTWDDGLKPPTDHWFKPCSLRWVVSDRPGRTKLHQPKIHRRKRIFILDGYHLVI